MALSSGRAIGDPHHAGVSHTAPTLAPAPFALCVVWSFA